MVVLYTHCCKFWKLPFLADVFPAATIYQNNTNSYTCSGAAYIAYISRCYNTSWAYYSIDQCTPVTSGSSPSTSSTSASTSDTSSTDNGISGGAIAGAIVGSVCGLGIIAAVCVYLFWFRPKQKEKEKKEREDAESRAAAEVEAKKREEESKAGPKPHELQQQPPELQSPERVTELPIDGVFEAPGDGGGVEVDNDAQLPAELPGDQVYWSSNSSGRSEEVERNRR